MWKWYKHSCKHAETVFCLYHHLRDFILTLLPHTYIFGRALTLVRPVPVIWKVCKYGSMPVCKNASIHIKRKTGPVHILACEIFFFLFSYFWTGPYFSKARPSNLKCLCVCMYVCSHMLFVMCFFTSNLPLQTLSHLVQ